MGTHTAYIEPGSPWENPYIESFNGRLRDECLNTEDFADLLEARVVLEDWRTEYNAYRPHQSLGGTPLYLVERLWRGSVGAGCSPRRVGL